MPSVGRVLATDGRQSAALTARAREARRGQASGRTERPDKAQGRQGNKLKGKKRPSPGAFCLCAVEGLIHHPPIPEQEDHTALLTRRGIRGHEAAAQHV